MNDYIIVRSKSGRHRENGYALGRYLCRDKEHVETCIKDHEIHDPIIESYEAYMAAYGASDE